MPGTAEHQDRRLRLLLAGVAVLVFFLCFLFSAIPLGRSLELTAYDSWFSFRGEIEPPDNIVIVKIDVESEQSLGRYPWNRRYHARLIRNLARAGAKVVAFDATFADRDPNEPGEDLALKEAIDESGIVVLGAKTSVTRHRMGTVMGLEEPAGDLADAPYGMVDMNPSSVDGVIREYPVLLAFPGGKIVPELGLVAISEYLGLAENAVVSTPSGWRVGDIDIPYGRRGGMMISFIRSTPAVPSYSYASVVDDAETDIGDWDMDAFEDFPEDLFADKIVFVGSTVPEHQDLWLTPFRAGDAPGATLQTPGVEIHVNAVDTILRRRFIRPASGIVNLLVILLLTIGVVYLTSHLKARWGGVTGLVLIFAVFLAAALLFTHARVWILSVTPSLAVLLSYSSSTVVLYLVEQKEKARIREMFQQYVPPRVVSELIAHPELLSLGGEERELTVMFSDVAGFTSISENLSPTELVSLLNEYLTAMTEIVLKYEGIIDKYEGDALMAEFGAPIPFPDHALRACKAALEMQSVLKGLREKWLDEGKPEITARIGLNTGVMLVGNLGSLHIMDYTVMGDNVNLASRLEGTNKVYSTNICISEMTYEHVSTEIFCRELDLIRVKGKSKPVRIFEVLATHEAGVPAGRASMIERYDMALQHYRDREFEQALEWFREISELDPDDGPTRLYIRRCETYIETPPSPEWDGVFTMTTK